MIFIELFTTFFIIGMFTIGGGYAMLSLIQNEVVTVHGWIDYGTFTDIVAISQMTPGPIGINSATYIGFVAPASVNPELSGIWWALLGSCLATIAVVTPPYILTLYSSQFIRRHKDSKAIKAIFSGLRPVVVGLIASAAILLMNAENFCPDRSLSQLLISIAICAAAFCLVYFKIPFKGKKIKLHPIFVIIIAGIAGYLIYGL